MNTGSATVGAVDGIDVDAVHAAVSSCPGVARLGSGEIGELATYLPGRRVSGVRVNSDRVQLEVSAVWGHSAKEIGEQIWSALAAIVTDRPVDITVTDIERAPLSRVESEST